MVRLLRGMIRVCLFIAGFLFIFNLPFLLGIGKESIKMNFQAFWKFAKSDFLYLFQTKDENYLLLFKQLPIAESYQYTLTILFASLALVIILSMFIILLIMLVPLKIRNRIRSMVNFFEAVPDLLVIFLIQFSVITLYKTTGLKFLQLYGVFGHKPYFVPIVTISFLPLFLFLQFLIKVITEEQMNEYVLYAKAKGIGKFGILLVHILRNIFPLFVLQLRVIVWVLLSNIYLVEFIFNINGFTKQLEWMIFRGGDFATLVLCLLMFTLPLIVLEAGGRIAARKIRGRGAVGL